ncbi:MAG: response regulator transcription factor [Bacteroidaceae bacterium]|nr:response regulator transcription factor [Bacteroidaceae bacterium]
MNHKILIVDDESDIREILQFNLELAGYETEQAASAEEALEKRPSDFSLLLLDVMMGGMSGFALAEHLRRDLHCSVPIIFLTAKDREEDLLSGFSAGGDDYIAKPFSLREVLARVKAVLARSSVPAGNVTAAVKGLQLCEAKKMVMVDGAEVKLSPKEYGILALLLAEPERIFSREEILEKVWCGESFVLPRTVDVHIARIRRKLSAEGFRIVNRQGYGYSFDAEGL